MTKLYQEIGVKILPLVYKGERRYNLIVEGKFLKVELQEVVVLKSGRTIWGSQWYILIV